MEQRRVPSLPRTATGISRLTPRSSSRPSPPKKLHPRGPCQAHHRGRMFLAWNSRLVAQRVAKSNSQRGAKLDRIETKDITLTGVRPDHAVTSPPTAVTHKSVAVTGTGNGNLNLHGKPYYQTCFRLSATVLVGANSLSCSTVPSIGRLLRRLCSQRRARYKVAPPVRQGQSIRPYR